MLCVSATLHTFVLRQLASSSFTAFIEEHSIRTHLDRVLLLLHSRLLCMCNKRSTWLYNFPFSTFGHTSSMWKTQFDHLCNLTKVTMTGRSPHLSRSSPCFFIFQTK